MTTALTRPHTAGRHRAPESAADGRCATPVDSPAAEARAGRHAAPEGADRDLPPLGAGPQAR